MTALLVAAVATVVVLTLGGRGSGSSRRRFAGGDEQPLGWERVDGIRKCGGPMEAVVVVPAP
jgi:hypothetical protein